MSHTLEALRLWITIVKIVASIGATGVPFLYVFAPWRSHLVGRLFMLQAISLALTIDVYTVFQFWRPDILVRYWIYAISLSTVAVSTVLMTGLMAQMLRLRYSKGGYDGHE